MLLCRTHHFSDFGALLTGDRGGGQGGSDSDDGNAFGNAEFTTIFAVSWFLILLAIVLSVTVIVISYKVNRLIGSSIHLVDVESLTSRRD